MEENNTPRRVKVLRDQVAKRIAAGEVIDRPYSIVRELLDNAIDSGADKIDLYIEDGGITRIRLIDNGCGMSLEDLKLCTLPHATSKIETENDLEALHTLGFRGEALSSVAACTRLEIVSRTEEADSAHRLVVQGGQPEITPYQGTRGTIIDTSDLFFSLPARKHFLKRPSAETGQCVRIFTDKALSFPHIQFRLYTDGKMKLFLPKADLKKRIRAAYPGKLPESLLFEVSEDFGNYQLTIVAGHPELARSDRRYIQIYANHRRIEEYSLMQAVQYGFGEVLPGGSFPMAFVFLQVRPDLVDFNIHPAKKEARFRNLPEIHKSVVGLIKSHIDLHFKAPQRGAAAQSMASHSESPELFPRESSSGLDAQIEQRPSYGGNNHPHFESGVRKESFPFIPSGYRPSAREARNFAAAVREAPNRFSGNSLKPESPGTLPPPVSSVETAKESDTAGRYLGQLMDLFLLYEKEETLFLIDQHAAHERILFDRLSSGQGGVQQLLIPLSFEIERDYQTVLEGNQIELETLGIFCEKLGDGHWELRKIPSVCVGHEGTLIEALQEPSGDQKSLRAALFATLACKAAIKDGARLDSVSGKALAEEALQLPEARCPHGRPVWTTLSRTELFSLVGRT